MTYKMLHLNRIKKKEIILSIEKIFNFSNLNIFHKYHIFTIHFHIVLFLFIHLF